MCKPKCDNSGAAVVVVAVALAVIVAERHAIGRFAGEVIHWAVVVGLVLVAAAAVYAVVWITVRQRLPVQRTSSLRWVRHVLLAAWVMLTWRSMCRRLGLVSRDRQVRSATEKRPKKAHHPLALVYPTRAGVVVRARTVAGTGRAEVEKHLDHFADHWRCRRVALAQPRPGVFVLRGLRTDPLVAPFTIAQAPPAAYSGADLTRAYMGRDEHGQHRWMTVKNNTAATYAGMPGRGKSVAINGLLMQWAPSPACQFGTADGKAPGDAGDYEPWRPRAWRSIGDNREACADMLSDACAVMRERLARVVELTGHRNAWHIGPTVDFPLFGIVLDEAQRFLDLSSVKGRDKDAERLVLHCQVMAGDFARLSRSVLGFLVLATQKATTDSLPSQIRDNAALSLALAQKTRAASKAALGDDIADYESFMPTTLQGDEYVGCAIASMRTGADPFTRLKFPEVTTAQLGECAARTAHLRRDPAALLPAAPDDARELVSP